MRHNALPAVDETGRTLRCRTGIQRSVTLHSGTRRSGASGTGSVQSLKAFQQLSCYIFRKLTKHPRVDAACYPNNGRSFDRFGSRTALPLHRFP